MAILKLYKLFKLSILMRKNVNTGIGYKMFVGTKFYFYFFTFSTDMLFLCFVSSFPLHYISSPCPNPVKSYF